MIWRISNCLSPIIITCNLHQGISWIKLLAELYYALQIVIENISIIKIQIWLAKSFLIAFDHHKNDFLIIIRTFKEITQITLFLNFFSSFYHWVGIFYILVVIFIIPMNLKHFSTIVLDNGGFFIFRLFYRLLFQGFWFSATLFLAFLETFILCFFSISHLSVTFFIYFLCLRSYIPYSINFRTGCLFYWLNCGVYRYFFFFIIIYYFYIFWRILLEKHICFWLSRSLIPLNHRLWIITCNCRLGLFTL